MTVNCQMNTDDTVIYLHAKNKKKAAEELSAAMVNISNVLINSCLYLNVNKMYVNRVTTRGDVQYHIEEVLLGSQPFLLEQHIPGILSPLRKFT